MSGSVAIICGASVCVSECVIRSLVDLFVCLVLDIPGILGERESRNNDLQSRLGDSVSLSLSLSVCFCVCVIEHNRMA